MIVRSMKNFFRRLRFLTHSGVQIRLASVFLIWFAAFIGIFGFIFFINFSSISEKAESMTIHDQLLTKVLLVEQSKNLAVWYGIAIFAYVLLMWLYILVYSHRLTGPVFKITQILKKSAEQGEWPKKITLRKSDAFVDLADAVNAFTEAMNKKK